MEKQKNYGFFSNYIYVLKMAAKSKKTMLVVTFLLGATGIFGQLLGVYTPKIILSLIENHSPMKTFIIDVVFIGLCICMLDIVGNFFWQTFDILYVKTDSFLQKLRMNKVYHTDYKNMESPEFLDYVQKAKNALYRGQGFYGILFESRNFLGQGTLTIITAILIGRKNLWVMLSICVMSVIVAKILSFVTRLDKEKFTDYMAPTYRKINYLERTTRNFDFAKDIRLFHMSGIFKNQFDQLNTLFIKKNREHHNRWILCNFGMESIILIQKTLMYVWLVYLVVTTGMSISDFVLYIGLITTFNDAIGNLSWIFSYMKLNSLMVNDYRNFVEWKEEKESKSPDEDVITDLDFDHYEFEFQNVSFKYPGHDEYVLKNINFKINSGMNLAIVGINGAGKTSFIKLIMKLYEPTEGRILLNGVDIKKYNREAYYKIFSPVFQNVECFALPVYQNISFADKKETDMDRIDRVLKKSGLDEKINSYEHGSRTNLLKIFDEKGIDLSGGERQRLAMARALYKDGKVIILDEPTAALDALAEDRMYREFESMVGKKTSIFISHRLGSTQFCDKIAMFEDGRIVEEGTHEELMRWNKKYAYMFNIQSKYYKGGQRNENI